MAVPGTTSATSSSRRVFGCRSSASCAARATIATRRSTEAFIGERGRELVNSGQFDGMPVAEAKRAIIEWLAEQGLAKRGRELSPARLVHLAPALLGSADPDHLLRRVRPAAGAGGGSAGDAAGHRGLQARRFRRVAAGASRGLVSSCRARSAARWRVARPTCPTPSWTARGTSCAIRARSRRRAVRCGADDASGCRWTSYIGGNEHAVLHLMYSRFITMVLHDMGHLTSRSRSRASARTATSFANGAKMSKTQRQRRQSPTSTSRRGAPTRSARISCSSDRTRKAATSATRASRASGASSIGCGRQSCGRDHGGRRRIREVMRKLHQTIAKVGDDIPRLELQHGHRGDDGVHERAAAG